jgi:hypothetical protein
MSDVTTTPTSQPKDSACTQEQLSSQLAYFSAWDVRAARFAVIGVAGYLKYTDRLSDEWCCLALLAAFMGPVLLPAIRMLDRFRSGGGKTTNAVDTRPPSGDE